MGKNEYICIYIYIYQLSIIYHILSIIYCILYIALNTWLGVGDVHRAHETHCVSGHSQHFSKASTASTKLATATSFAADPDKKTSSNPYKRVPPPRKRKAQPMVMCKNSLKHFSGAKQYIHIYIYIYIYIYIKIYKIINFTNPKSTKFELWNLYI